MNGRTPDNVRVQLSLPRNRLAATTCQSRSRTRPLFATIFDVVRSERDDSIVPHALSEIEPLLASQATRTRTFIFDALPSWGFPPKVRWLINGKEFDPDRVDADPKLGEIEIWRFLRRASWDSTCSTRSTPISFHFKFFIAMAARHVVRRADGKTLYLSDPESRST